MNGALLGILLVAQLGQGPARDWQQVLAAHVVDGRVDYAALEKKSLEPLDRYLASVAKAELPEGKDARIGFLIDAYNALVVRAVIESGHQKSVLAVPDFFKAKRHRIAGRTLSLDQLEKELLMPFAKDPRLHFVLVCAAKGCPDLEAVPFSGQPVGARLDAATRRYLAQPKGARVEANKLGLSQIFSWYAADFGGEDGVRRFVLDHLAEPARKLAGPKPALSYVDYDWALNAP